MFRVAIQCVGRVSTRVAVESSFEKLTLSMSPELRRELIDCWVVTTDYNKPNEYLARFWIGKDSQTVVREHFAAPDGSAVVKALLPSTL